MYDTLLAYRPGPNKKQKNLRTYSAPESLRGFTVSPVLPRTNPHNVRVDSTGNTVLHLCIELRKSVACNKHCQLTLSTNSSNKAPKMYTFIKQKITNSKREEITFINTCLLDIPNSSLLNNVPHQKPLDGFVLFHTNPNTKLTLKLI